MDIPLINEGLELEKKATPGEWFYDGMCYLFSGTPDDAQMVADEHDGTIRMRGAGANLPLETNAEFICWVRNNAKDLLEAAKWAVERGYGKESTHSVDVNVSCNKGCC